MNYLERCRPLLLLTTTMCCGCGSAETESRVEDSGSGQDAVQEPQGRDAPIDDAAAQDADGGVDVLESGVDSGVRSFYLASSGTQSVIGQEPFFQLTAANLGDDVDLIAMHMDFYGLPWEAFETGQPPPAEWTAVMDGLVQVAQTAGKGVFLSLQMVGGKGRKYLPDRTVIEDGKLKKLESWSAECYDYASASDAATKRSAYLAYVDYMVRRFQPRFVNVGVEMSMFMACGAAWDGLVQVERAAYDTAKAAKPDVVAFPSIQIDHLYGYAEGSCPAPKLRAECYDESYAKLANLKRDRFAVSTYPYLAGIKTVAEIPADWFTRAADRGGERPAIAELGWNSDSVIAMLDTKCITAIASSPSEQIAYLDRVLGAAESSNMDLVTWWSNRDLIPSALMTNCPCNYDAQWCAVIDALRATGESDPQMQFYGEATFKIWGTMGIRDYNGAPKPGIYDRWKSVQNLPVSPH